MDRRLYENSSRSIIAYSDDGRFKLVATRRSPKTEVFGRTKFVGSYWTVETFALMNGGYKPYTFAGLKSRYAKKEEILSLMAGSQNFKQAYKEMKP